MIPEELLPGYWNIDPLTEKRWGATENRGYHKTALWEIEFQGKDPAVPYYEHAAHVYDNLDTLDTLVKFIGPIDNPKFLTERLLMEMAYEERRWNERNEYLSAIYESVGGNIDDPEFQEALAAVMPRSWECYKYSGWCDFIHICHQRDRWEVPLELDKYIRRTPNHPIELQAIPFKELANVREAEQKASGIAEGSP